MERKFVFPDRFVLDRRGLISGWDYSSVLRQGDRGSSLI